MKSRRKHALSLIASLIVFALALSGCSGITPAQPEEPAGEHNARVTQGLVTNSSTDELLDEFWYLHADIRNDHDAIQTENYEDVATIRIWEDGSDMYTSYLYDAKRKTVFMDYFRSPSVVPADFGFACELSEADVETLTDTLKVADTHAWREEYKGKNGDTGWDSWSITIEYRDGTFEYHHGDTVDCGPGSKNDVMMLFSSYDYVENHIGEHNARVTADYVLNGSTEELLEDFGYLFEDIRNDAEAAKTQDYEDVVTVFVEDYDGDMQSLWLYDAKRGTVFHDVGLDHMELPSAYEKSYQLSDEERAELTDTLKGSGSHEWDEYYPGENVGTGSYSWAIIIEYRDGTFEFHKGHGNNAAFPTGYNAILMLLVSYFYGN